MACSVITSPEGGGGNTLTHTQLGLLTLVEEQRYLVEGLHEVHVVVAVLLHLDEQRQLWCALLTERQEQLCVHLHTQQVSAITLKYNRYIRKGDI